MILVIEPDQSCWVVINGKKKLLRDLMRETREEKGLSMSRLQTDAGLDHPTYRNFEKGLIKTPINGLIALNALGYDIYIRRRSE